MKISSISLGLPKYGKQYNVSSLKKTNHVSSGVSFSASDENYERRPFPVSPEVARAIEDKYVHATSGYRERYPSDKFNPDIVAAITHGFANYEIENARQNKIKPYVIIGGDTRRATRESLPLIADILVNHGIEVLIVKEPVATPALAVGAKKFGMDAILLTASHYSWDDGGFNFLTKNATIAPASITRQISQHIVNGADRGYYEYVKLDKGTAIDVDLFSAYSDAIDDLRLINWSRIRNANIDIYYDSLNGTGGYFMPKLMKSRGIGMNVVYSSGQEGPYPTPENLQKLSSVVKSSNNPLKIGLSNDGDADRFGVIDEYGNFVNANDVILLAGYHLAKNKERTGSVIRTQASSCQIDALADLYYLKKIETAVGFNKIGKEIEDLRENGDDILVAGEESGGLTVNGHIPEKDGIVADLIMLDLMAREQKPLSVILNEVKSQLPHSYSINNFSVPLESESKKIEIMEKFENIYQKAMKGDVRFDDRHDIDPEKTAAVRANMEKYKKGGDGYKLIFTDGSSVLVRPSGTEPIIKVYIDGIANSSDSAENNSNYLKDTVDSLLNN